MEETSTDFSPHPAPQVSILQTNIAELERELLNEIVPKSDVREQMIGMGFPAEIVDFALKSADRNMDAVLEELMRLQSEGTYDEMLEKLIDAVDAAEGTSSADGSKPSTSKKFKDAIEEEKNVGCFSEAALC